MAEEPDMSVSARLSKPRAFSTLCQTCRDLLIRPFEPNEVGVKAVYKYKSVVRAVQRGCPICVRLHQWLWINFYRFGDEHGARLTHATLSKSYTAWPDQSSAPDARNMYLFIGVEGQKTFILWLGTYRHSAKQLLLDMHRVHPSNENDVPVAITIPTHNASMSRLATLKHWIANCEHEHPRCRRLAKENHDAALPTRLIHIGTAGQVCLCITNDLEDQGHLRYATVTHRWLEGVAMPNLLKNNLLAMQQGIVAQSLPPVFRHAMKVCRYLGIRYVWIDALCLIQDDTEDCEKEIAKMGDIYSKAFLNLGATAAAECPERGLFFSSKPASVLPFHIPVHRRGVTVDYLAFEDAARIGPEMSALMFRGWVLQERLLSPRSIYFGSVVSWECPDIIANEVFPGGIPMHYGNGAEWGKQRPFRLSTLLEDNEATVSTNPGAELYSNWRFLSRRFTECALSREADALPAISGLARVFSGALQDSYLAGIWRNDLVPGLLWYVGTYQTHNGTPKPTPANVYPQHYRGKPPLQPVERY